MSTETILAVTAIVLAVVNRPLELLWDKLFEHKSIVAEYLWSFFQFTFKFILPVVGILYMYFYLPFDKKFIVYVALFSGFFFTYLVIDLLRSSTKTTRHIIELLADEHSKLREDVDILIEKEVVPNIKKPDYIKYKKDILKKWIWRWDWEYKAGEGWVIKNLTPYCPKDDVKLILDTGYVWAKCPKCESVFTTKEIPYELSGEIAILIMDKVTKDTYPKD